MSRGGEGAPSAEHVTDVRSVATPRRAAPFLLPFSSHFFILLFLLARVPHYVRPSRSRSERSRGVRGTYSRIAVFATYDASLTFKGQETAPRRQPSEKIAVPYGGD